MIDSKKRKLIIIAAVIWFGGFIALGLKALTILSADLSEKNNSDLVWFLVGVGIFAGILKAGLIFIRSCKRNIRRILSLTEPKIWLIFEPRFTFFLLLMLLFAVIFSRLSERFEGFHYGVATLDISISVALFISGVSFFIRKNYQIIDDYSS